MIDKIIILAQFAAALFAAASACVGILMIIALLAGCGNDVDLHYLPGPDAGGDGGDLPVITRPPPPPPPPPPPCYPEDEICNGRDDDCDGVVDNIDPQFYFPPDTGAVNFAPDSRCRPGLLTCVNGQPVIDGLSLPSVEVCGNGVDDDCDGRYDESDSQEDASAILLTIDLSGSMNDNIQNVADVVCENDLSPHAWALIAYGAGRHAALLVEDFSYDTARICQFLRSEEWRSMSTIVNEWAGRAVEGAFEGLSGWSEAEIMPSESSPVEMLSWPVGLRKSVFNFTDEIPQDYQPGYDGGELIRDYCSRYKFRYGVFTAGSTPTAQWEPIADDCGGFVDDLDGPPHLIGEMIARRADEGC